MNRAQLLDLAGNALYGDRWQTQLAMALRVSDRTMRRWVADPSEIKRGVWSDIQQLLLNRIIQIENMRQDISGAILDAPQ